MKKIDWDPKKNRQLIEERDGLLDDIVALSSNKKHAHQRIFIVAIEGYAYFVPYIESGNEIFLQTITPNQKATAQFLRENNDQCETE